MTHKYETLQSVYDAAKAHLLSMTNPSKGEGKNSDMCLYRSPDGNKCVAGFFIPDDLYDEEMEDVSASNLFGFRSNVALLEIFHPDIRSAIPDFLSDLQGVHDRKSYWGKDGLNEAGKNDLIGIARNYGLEP